MILICEELLFWSPKLCVVKIFCKSNNFPMVLSPYGKGNDNMVRVLSSCADWKKDSWHAFLFLPLFLHGTLSTPRLVVWRMKHAFDLSALQITTCRIRLSSSHYNFSQQSGTLFKFVETEAFLRGLNKLKQSSLMSMLSSPTLVKLCIQ